MLDTGRSEKEVHIYLSQEFSLKRYGVEESDSKHSAGSQLEV